MTVKRVTIENVKGIEFAELILGERKLTVLKGQNASGKTSLLDAIRSVFEGGSDPALIRKGAEKAKIEIELSTGATITKRQTLKGAQLTMIDEHGETVKSPQAYVNSLAESFAFDPLAFCRAPAKQRADWLLKAMPVEFKARELHGLKFGKVDASAAIKDLIPEGETVTLEALDQLRVRVYERRRTANVAAKELEAAVNNLRKSIPVEGAEADAGSLPKLKAELDRRESEEIRESEDIRTQATDARLEAQKRYEKEIEDIRREEYLALDEVKRRYTPERERLKEQIAVAERALKYEGEIQALKKHLEEQRSRLADKVTLADSLDRALQAIDELRAKKISTLPIEGLEIRNGEVFRDSIPFDHLNQAKQYCTAVEIGSLRAGTLPLVICDEAEHLDPDQQKAFYEAVEASGLQVIMARVEEGPLRSEPVEALRT